MDAAYIDKALLINPINCIMKALKEEKKTGNQPHSSPKKTKWAGDVLVSIAAAVENDWRRTV
jgi:hypothetical protein